MLCESKPLATVDFETETQQFCSQMHVPEHSSTRLYVADTTALLRLTSVVSDMIHFVGQNSTVVTFCYMLAAEMAC